MLTAIEGFYENGQIHLNELPSLTDKTKVVVTFLTEKIESTISKRKLGSLSGKIAIPNTFNEPLDELNDYMF